MFHPYAWANAADLRLSGARQISFCVRPEVASLRHVHLDAAGRRNTFARPAPSTEAGLDDLLNKIHGRPPSWFAQELLMAGK